MLNISESDKIAMPKAKRLFDILFSSLLIIFSSPLFFVIILAIFVEHIFRGDFFASLFYVEKRISQGETFNFRKFNIFKPDILNNLREQGIFIHTKVLERDGKSLTYVGKILQKIYLDELPQLFNILKGDISVVGPRPVNKEVYQNSLDRGVFAKKVIKAGLTGNYQSLKGLTKRSDIELDSEYINYCLNNSSWKIVLFDLKIILRTFFVMFRAEGI